jgi:predicted permease
MCLTVDSTVETKLIVPRALKTVMVPRALFGALFSCLIIILFFFSCITRKGQRFAHVKTGRVVPAVHLTRMGMGTRVVAVLAINLRPHDHEECQMPRCAHQT